jgi:putative ABC transport system permease protein
LQVFMETTVIVCLALVMAVGLAALALPYVKNIMDVQSRLALFNRESILFIIIITLVTILLSGAYPAFVMGRFKPVEAIKNKINTMKIGNVSLRRVLVVLQFTFSQVLIIATIIAISQMNFIRNADLGFNKESVLIITINSDSASLLRHAALKNDLLARTDVKQVSFGYDAPSSDDSWINNFAFDKMEDRDFGVNVKFGDENYINTYGIEIIAGKGYDAGDTARGYLVNQTFLARVGIREPQDAIGKMLKLGGSRPKPVIGVVKDFKLHSLKQIIPPIVLSPRKAFYNTIGVKLSGNNLLRSREEIQQIWNRNFPEYVYDASFLDDTINDFYRQEQRRSLMYNVYALLAIFISCLGLYGLGSFMVVQKTKEVGIRKVLGASVRSIMYLFSKEFTILITLAFVLAAPAAWYLMHTWLQDFKYRIRIGAGVFIAAVLLSVGIAWLTVGYKALKAALANPVKSLRAE